MRTFDKDLIADTVVGFVNKPTKGGHLTTDIKSKDQAAYWLLRHPSEHRPTYKALLGLLKPCILRFVVL